MLRSLAKSVQYKFIVTRPKRFYSSSYILNSNVPDVPIPKISLPEMLSADWDKYHNLTAMECGITGRKYTFEDLQQESTNLSKSLLKTLKLNEGDVVAVLLPNVPEYPIVILGALRAGLVLTTLNPNYRAEEIARQLEDSSARLLITLNSSYEVANNARLLLRRELVIVAIKTEQGESLNSGAIDFAQFTKTKVDFNLPHPRLPQDLAILPYSSGTTGLPKGVQLTHHNLVANNVQNRHPVLEIFRQSSGDHQDVIPGILPMFHIYALSTILFSSLGMGNRMVTLPKFSPETFMGLLERHRPQLMFLVPPIVLFLTAHAGFKAELVERLRLIFTGAAPLGALDEQKLIGKIGRDVLIQGYGLTESSPTVSSTRLSSKKATGSIGLPVPNTLVKITPPEDPLAAPLGPNVPGELLISGPQVMAGYLNRPEDTDRVIVRDPEDEDRLWLRTGDTGHHDPEGRLFVTDRLKELIKVKGFQVAPAELEEILRDHPDVADAAVVGVGHERWGEVPRAFVVVKEGRGVDEGGLRRFVDGRVAEYKRLEGGVRVVGRIPKNPSGKILRRELRQEGFC